MIGLAKCSVNSRLVGEKKSSHVPEFRRRHSDSYLVSLLFAAPIPTLGIFNEIFATCSYTFFITIV